MGDYRRRNDPVPFFPGSGIGGRGIPGAGISHFQEFILLRLLHLILLLGIWRAAAAAAPPAGEIYCLFIQQFIWGVLYLIIYFERSLFINIYIGIFPLACFLTYKLIYVCVHLFYIFMRAQCPW